MSIYATKSTWLHVVCQALFPSVLLAGPCNSCLLTPVLLGGLRLVANGLLIPPHESRRGGIGRRAGLKIQFTQVSVGSIPSVGRTALDAAGFVAQAIRATT